MCIPGVQQQQLPIFVVQHSLTCPGLPSPSLHLFQHLLVELVDLREQVVCLLVVLRVHLEQGPGLDPVNLQPTACDIFPLIARPLTARGAAGRPGAARAELPARRPLAPKAPDAAAGSAVRRRPPGVVVARVPPAAPALQLAPGGQRVRVARGLPLVGVVGVLLRPVRGLGVGAVQGARGGGHGRVLPQALAAGGAAPGERPQQRVVARGGVRVARGQGHAEARA
eukprot:CAMPEP_0206398826 /NCGR_PEP_ID=MMETSP0294-20121207/24407_1 /ASSEMBLY_ACC=CAM_ASM_000327 /TAXON_ID=39354 /ORGANISM="Heterosigma akashiwo, Strain CCMP2393" /LENGTH=224 /DNA_ID=CAMNT_0053854413 /DNA_START=653 /DNA_END=1323 /DNA_ORIENTATION=-